MFYIVACIIYIVAYMFHVVERKNYYYKDTYFC